MPVIPCLYLSAMQPEHNCCQDCETIHREICKKIMLMIANGHSIITSEKANTWFGLSVHGSLVDQEALARGFLSADGVKRLQIAIYLDNSDDSTILTFEPTLNAQRAVISKPSILLELWNLEFSPKITQIDPSSVAKLYKITSFYVRSLWSVMRLLPAHRLSREKIKLSFEFIQNDFIDAEALREPFSSELSQSSCVVERVESVDIGQLSTLHGDLKLSVNFRSDVNFSMTSKTPAISFPRKLIPEHEIKIENSPDWVDMTQYANSRKNSSIKEPKSVSYRPVIVQSSQEASKSQELTEFIKFFEKPPPMKWIKNSDEPKPTLSSMLKQLEKTRSEKILLDRWLEEQEMAQENSKLDFSGFLESME